MPLRIMAHEKNNRQTSPFWAVFKDDRFICVANIRYSDGGIQNTKLGNLSLEDQHEVESVYAKTVHFHREWCDLNNCGLECNCDFGESQP